MSVRSNPSTGRHTDESKGLALTTRLYWRALQPRQDGGGQRLFVGRRRSADGGYDRHAHVGVALENAHRRVAVVEGLITETGDRLGGHLGLVVVEPLLR